MFSMMSSRDRMPTISAWSWSYTKAKWVWPFWNTFRIFKMSVSFCTNSGFFSKRGSNSPTVSEFSRMFKSLAWMYLIRLSGFYLSYIGMRECP